MFRLILLALSFWLVPLPSLAASNGTCVGCFGGGGGDVTGLPNPMDADLNAAGFDINNVGSLAATGGTDTEREILIGANTSYDCSTRAPATAGQVKILAEGGALKACDSDGNEVVLDGFSRVLIDSEVGASAVSDITVLLDDWQTTYSELYVVLSDVRCTTDARGVRIRYDNNGVETASGATIGSTWADPGSAAETLVESTTLRTDATELVASGVGNGVSGSMRVLSGGNSASDAFSIFADWAYAETGTVTIVRQSIASISGGLTSFDGFFIDCTNGDTINGSVYMYGYLLP